MNKKKIYIENIETPIGEFELCIVSSVNGNHKSEVKIISEKEQTIFSLSYKINLRSENLNLSLYNGSDVSTRKVWCFYFERYSRAFEKLEIIFTFISSTKNLKYGINGGEDLDALEYYNGKYQVHIGTEDDVLQKKRSINSDWLPPRYSKYLGYYDTTRKFKLGSFTQYQKSRLGFIIKIPRIRNQEKAYFHFILAAKECDDENSDTWLAVDISKKDLLSGYPNLRYDSHGV